MVSQSVSQSVVKSVHQSKAKLLFFSCVKKKKKTNKERIYIPSPIYPMYYLPYLHKKFSISNTMKLLLLPFLLPIIFTQQTQQRKAERGTICLSPFFLLPSYHHLTYKQDITPTLHLLPSLQKKNAIDQEKLSQILFPKFFS